MTFMDNVKIRFNSCPMVVSQQGPQLCDVVSRKSREGSALILDISNGVKLVFGLVHFAFASFTFSDEHG